MQGRGTQQRGSHSPTLFGRVLSGRFDQLSDQWLLCGERPAFLTSLLALWALWFIDDPIFIFRTLSQLLRLMPAVVDLLQNLGLSINVSKSCLLLRRCPVVCQDSLELSLCRLLLFTWACHYRWLRLMNTWLIPCAQGPPPRISPTEGCLPIVLLAGLCACACSTL